MQTSHTTGPLRRRIPRWLRTGLILLFVCGVLVAGYMLYRATRQTATVGSHSLSGAAPDVTDTAVWKSTFSDDFDGTALNRSKWATCYDFYDSANYGCTNAGNNEQEWYTREQVQVKDGAATLTAVKQQYDIYQNGATTSFPYRSGMINSGRDTPTGNVKYSQTYGYYEARIKMDGGKGVWPAFWLLPADQKWPPELDIMEFLGDKTHEIIQTVHWQAPGKADNHDLDYSIVQVPDQTQGWHTYAVDWQPHKITWYIDGKTQKIYTGPNVPSKPMEIILNLAIGGKLPGNADESTVFPKRMAIDYVHVYSKR